MGSIIYQFICLVKNFIFHKILSCGYWLIFAILFFCIFAVNIKPILKEAIATEENISSKKLPPLINSQSQEIINLNNNLSYRQSFLQDIFINNPDNEFANQNQSNQEKYRKCLKNYANLTAEKEIYLEKTCYNKSLIVFDDKLINNKELQQSITKAKNLNNYFDNQLNKSFNSIGIDDEELDSFHATENGTKNLAVEQKNSSFANRNNDNLQYTNTANKRLSHKNIELYSKEEIILFRKIYTDRCIEHFGIQFEQEKQNSIKICNSYLN